MAPRIQSTGFQMSENGMSMETRRWLPDELRDAQLRIAEAALQRPKTEREAWLRETLDILGLLPSTTRHAARHAFTYTPGTAKIPLPQETTETLTDVERLQQKNVDPQGHGTLAGYNMHIKRYERPCEYCQLMKDMVMEQDLRERGVRLTLNHTIGYQ